MMAAQSCKDPGHREARSHVSELTVFIAYMITLLRV